MSKTVKIDKGGFIYLECFSDWFDITKVKYYSLKVRKHGVLVLKFYDKKKKLVKPKGKPCLTSNT